MIEGYSPIPLYELLGPNSSAGGVSAAAGVASPSLWDNFSKLWSGGKDTTTGMQTNGIGGTVLGIAQGLGNFYMGSQQLKLAKQSLAQSKDQFNRNFEAQRSTTNAQLQDRQRARVASNAGAYQSVGDYMAQYGIR